MASLEAAGSDACGPGVGELSDALERLRIFLESGNFTAATGFTLQGTVAAVIDEKAISKKAASPPARSSCR